MEFTELNDCKFDIYSPFELQFVVHQPAFAQRWPDSIVESGLFCLLLLRGSSLNEQIWNNHNFESFGFAS